MKKALLIGINDYAPVGTGGPDLNGCVNDLVDMYQTITSMGIVPSQPNAIKILYNKTATRANIISGIKWLIAKAQEGDRLVFHYSGHGSQTTDTSGAELDNRDETICPHDFATAGMIKDDDFMEHFSGLPAGVTLDVILDSCHSGTGTRELAAFNQLNDSDYIAYRYVEPPLDERLFLESNPNLPVRGLFGSRPTETGMRTIVPVEGMDHVLWASCRDNQTCAEAKIDGKIRGVFTYCFCKCLRSEGMGVTRRRLESRISAMVKDMGYGQVCQLEGRERIIDAGIFT